MRVTQRMMTENAIRHMDENSKKLLELHEKVASGKQFQRVSDNPAAATTALSLRSSLEANKSYVDAVNRADDWMSANDYALDQMLDVATRANNLALSGVSDTLGVDERKTLAIDIGALLQQAVDIGNTRHEGNYIFGGYRTDNKPFTLVDADADTMYDSVQYNNNPGTEVILRSIGPGQSVPLNIEGNNVFTPLYSALIATRDALLTNDSAAIQGTLQGLKDAIGVVNEASTTNGARQRQVRQVGDRLEKAQTEIKSLLSLKEDANMAEAIASLRLQETIYQSVLEVGQRAISALNLFDMLS